MFSLSLFPLCALLEGTHSDRVAGNNTQHSHRRVSSSTYATRSRAKKSTLARSLVQSVKLDARFLAAVATRVPSLNKHIPCISTLRMSFISFQLSFLISFKASPIPIINLFFTAIAFKSCSDKVQNIFPSSPTTSNVVLLCLPT